MKMIIKIGEGHHLIENCDTCKECWKTFSEGDVIITEDEEHYHEKCYKLKEKK